MDKFNVVNEIVKEPVVVDGTSATAALKAGYTGHLPGTNKMTGQEYSPSDEKEDIKLSTRDQNTIERFSSAPTKGGDPKMLWKSPGNDKEARVYLGNSHIVGNKLIGCPDPNNTPPVPDTTQGLATLDAPAPDNSLHPLPSIANGSLPRVRHHTASGRFSDRKFSTWQSLTPSISKTAPAEVHSSGVGINQERGMPFANQVPPFALSQHQPPPILQQTHQDPTIYKRSGGRACRVDASTVQQPENPAAPYDGTGTWQHVGSDEIHGPKAVFRKGSTHSQHGGHHRPSQWHGWGSNAANRRLSMASNNSSRRFSNATPRISAGFTRPYNINNKWNPANQGGPGDMPTCVNFGKLPNTLTKFDPCHCTKCKDRDRTIYIRPLVPDVAATEEGKAHLTRHFSKYGDIDHITVSFKADNAAHIR